MAGSAVWFRIGRSGPRIRLRITRHLVASKGQNGVSRHRLELPMRHPWSLAIGVLALVAVQAASAGQDEFCAGFSEGYKSIKGDMVLVPLCPLAPLTPLG